MLFRVAATLAGSVVLVLTCWQVFSDLFHPTAQGSLSDWIARMIWRAMRGSESLRVAAGPIAFITVVFSWVFLLALGYALIYWPYLPDGFRFTGTPESGFLTAVYFSMEALTTLGLGEIVPRATWLRYAVTLESVVGLGVVTACVSWTVLLYPALSRMRLLARKTTLLADAAESTHVEAADSELLLRELGVEVLQTHVDLIYFPILFYFQSVHRRSSLAASLPVLLRFSDEGMQSSSERVHLAATMLRLGIEDVTKLIGRRFLRMGAADSVDSVLKEFAAEFGNRE